MASQWSKLKETAIAMRESGSSIREVEKKLGIPRSTLSGWFKNIVLSQDKLQLLEQRAKSALSNARIEAVKWHNAQKASRLEQAAQAALQSLSKIDYSDNATTELALALLYLGEGAKKPKAGTAMGNSDPLIMRFFVRVLQDVYEVPLSAMKCELHIRADQNAIKLMRYWSVTLGIPVQQFNKTSVDKRTAGRPTYSEYKGVCVVRCSRVAIQRKLVYIARTFCEKIAE